jgi:hypothetical protein
MSSKNKVKEKLNVSKHSPKCSMRVCAPMPIEVVLPKSGSEPKFEPELSWTGPEVRSKVRRSP